MSNLDSDSDLQAYINELSKKAQDWQYADEESALEGISTPSLSSIEIVVNKKGEKSGHQIAKQDATSNIIRELGLKYLKKEPKSAMQDISFSMSEDDLEIGEESIIDQSLKPEKSVISKERKITTVNLKTENPDEIKPEYPDTQIHDQEQINLLHDIIEFSRTHNREEDVKDKPIFHSTTQSAKVRRKSSETSLLNNKSGIFYSSSISTDRPSNLSNHSNSRNSSESDSIIEEIPELENDETMKPKKIEKLIHRQESVLYSVKESTEASQSDINEDSAGYGNEDTFESSEGTSSLKKNSLESDQKSEDNSLEQSQSSSEEKTVKSSKEDKPKQNSEETCASEKNLDSNESSQSYRSDESATQVSHKTSESVTQISHKSTESGTQMSRKSGSQGSSSSKASTSQMSPESLKKSKARHKTTSSESSLQVKPHSKKRLHRKRSINKRKHEKKIHKNKSKSTSEKRKKRPSPPSSDSSVDSSSESSIVSTSSFSVRMKRKKYNEKKKKLKHEREMTELIIKTLVKNLPIILRHSIGLNLEPTTESKPRYVCHNCGGNSVGYEVTNTRIDDALRQTIDLTRQFLDTHKIMLESEYRLKTSNFRYTRLKNYAVS